ncbi:hypothetical protein E2C01_033459 [Portunus trituberculatus]|uniref:Uncharacterized protein n=1 Tax=Portunus trituberculatus TaxID=210409 RepID=A0A5B7F2Z6_PORTR|nr:hypothetical protein [Portunus trituberculatus]
MSTPAGERPTPPPSLRRHPVRHATRRDGNVASTQHPSTPAPMGHLGHRSKAEGFAPHPHVLPGEDEGSSVCLLLPPAALGVKRDTRTLCGASLRYPSLSSPGTVAGHTPASCSGASQHLQVSGQRHLPPHDAIPFATQRCVTGIWRPPSTPAPQGHLGHPGRAEGSAPCPMYFSGNVEGALGVSSSQTSPGR